MVSDRREFEVARRTRYFAVVACRAGAALLIIIGSIDLLRGLLLYLPPAQMGIPGMQPDVIWFLTGLMELVPGVVLALGSAAIARWIAPAPEFRCLRCEYDAERSKSDRCPECGAFLGVDFETDGTEQNDG